MHVDYLLRLLCRKEVAKEVGDEVGVFAFQWMMDNGKEPFYFKWSHEPVAFHWWCGFQYHNKWSLPIRLFDHLLSGFGGSCRRSFVTATEAEDAVVEAWRKVGIDNVALVW